MPSLSVLICDLDNTLFDARSIPTTVLAPVHAALRAANTGEETLTSVELEAIIDASERMSFDLVVRELDVPPALAGAWSDAHARLSAPTPLRPFADVSVLWELPLERCLVTTGFRRFQESKVAALGLEALFPTIYIDALDDPVRAGKRALFERIVAERSMRPTEVIVVGDSPASELAVGSELGMVTVQILRPGVRASSRAQFRIASLTELPGVLRAVERARAF